MKKLYVMKDSLEFVIIFVTSCMLCVVLLILVGIKCWLAIALKILEAFRIFNERILGKIHLSIN